MSATTTVVAFSALLALTARPQVATDTDVFGGREGCFILQEGGAASPLERTGTLCAERLSPCSTFKIPNSLIGLETGVIADAGFVIPWDGVKRDREEWNRDQTLASAIKVSAVWYYQELARRVGKERMQRLVSAIPYGNGDTSSGIDVFWLGRSLRISPDEQVAFLERLRVSKLPFTERSQAIVRGILVQERSGSFAYRGKTGSCGGGTGPDHGWWVGWVERDGKATVFAMLVRGGGASGTEARRLAEVQLRKRGLLAP
ncbi:MAG TPA: penicillin-binding transpeptidase domain-containing protein [Vicinamibacteria bacterium]|nr:penicillin-binding transpeptidase domain-containing protein [Vicinamibacteria bacterium]